MRKSSCEQLNLIQIMFEVFWKSFNHFEKEGNSHEKKIVSDTSSHQSTWTFSHRRWFSRTARKAKLETTRSFVKNDEMRKPSFVSRWGHSRACETGWSTISFRDNDGRKSIVISLRRAWFHVNRFSFSGSHFSRDKCHSLAPKINWKCLRRRRSVSCN